MLEIEAQCHERSANKIFSKMKEWKLLDVTAGPSQGVKKKEKNVYVNSGLQIVDTFFYTLTLAMQNSGHLLTSFKGNTVRFSCKKTFNNNVSKVKENQMLMNRDHKDRTTSKQV